MNHEYSSADLMTAILNLKDFTESGFLSLRTEMQHGFEALEDKMKRRFDSVDLRFDAFERRLHLLEER